MSVTPQTQSFIRRHFNASAKGFALAYLLCAASMAVFATAVGTAGYYLDYNRNPVALLSGVVGALVGTGIGVLTGACVGIKASHALKLTNTRGAFAALIAAVATAVVLYGAYIAPVVLNS